jgi:hypothetical protein
VEWLSDKHAAFERMIPTFQRSGDKGKQIKPPTLGYESSIEHQVWYTLVVFSWPHGVQAVDIFNTSNHRIAYLLHDPAAGKFVY